MFVRCVGNRFECGLETTGLQVIVLDLAVRGGKGSLQVLQSYPLVSKIFRALFDICLELEDAFSFAA